MAAAAPSGTGRRAGLDHEDVVDAALALVESGGPSALTMRKLAAELGVTTTTIYWHVGGRDELILALIKRRSEQQAARPITGATPRERVESVATQIWLGALEHPNVTSLAHQVGATSLLELPLEVALARELEAAGVRGEAARDAMRAILLTVAGFLVAGLRRPDAKPPQHRGESLWAEVDDPGIAPETLTALQHAPDLAELFATTLHAVVASFVPDAPVRTPRRRGSR